MIELETARQFEIFESAYIKIRKEEGRVLSIEEIKKLPFAFKHNNNYSEWKKRHKSTHRLINYISKRSFKTVLDLGCGNGWLSYKIAPLVQNIIAMDVNKTELLQAEEVLEDSSNSEIIYGDVFFWDASVNIDLVIINAAIQYFENVPKLLEKLFSFISPNGEIHLIDSPMYSSKLKALKAKQRSRKYFEEYADRDMTDFYFHHHWGVLGNYQYQVLYKPDTIQRRILGKLGRYDSPFPWIKIST